MARVETAVVGSHCHLHLVAQPAPTLHCPLRGHRWAGDWHLDLPVSPPTTPSLAAVSVLSSVNQSQETKPWNSHCKLTDAEAEAPIQRPPDATN